VTQPPTWEGLLEILSTWSDAREVPGGIEVSFTTPTGASRTVQVVMSEHDWEELTWTIQRESPETLRERIVGLPADVPYLVCDSGVELVPSATPELPPDDFRPEPGGRWVALDANGNVQSYFAEWADRHERGGDREP
jgi:hypothetical protein